LLEKSILLPEVKINFLKKGTLMNKKMVFSILLLLSATPAVFYAAEQETVKVLAGKELDDELLRLATLRDEQITNFKTLQTTLTQEAINLESAIQSLEEAFSNKAATSTLLQQVQEKLTETTKKHTHEISGLNKQIKALQKIRKEKKESYTIELTQQTTEIANLEKQITDLRREIIGLKISCDSQARITEAARIAALQSGAEVNKTKAARAEIKPFTAKRIAAKIVRVATAGKLLPEDADNELPMTEFETSITKKYQLDALSQKVLDVLKTQEKK
jgi:exonuclease VII small subunit